MSLPARIIDIDCLAHSSTKEIARQLGLTCGICLGLLVPPVLETVCGHFFCAGCLDDVAACPLCRNPLSDVRGRSLSKQSTIGFNRLLCGLPVRCPNTTISEPASKRLRVDACSWEGAYGDLLGKHIRTCEMEHVKCPKGCKEDGLRRCDLQKHLAFSCPLGFVCDICGHGLPLSEQFSHAAAAAVLHVEILQARLRALTNIPTACSAVWEINNLSNLRKGEYVTSRNFQVDLPQGSFRFRARFFPRGAAGAAASNCSLELQFGLAPCMLAVVARLAGASCSADKEASINTSLAAPLQRSVLFLSFSECSDKDLIGKLTVSVSIALKHVILQTADPETVSDSDTAEYSDC